MRGAGVILRRLVGRRAPCLAARSSSIGGDLIVSSAAAAASYSTLFLAEEGARPLFASVVAHGRAASFNSVFINQNRNFSSPSSGLSQDYVFAFSNFDVWFSEDSWFDSSDLRLQWICYNPNECVKMLDVQWWRCWSLKFLNNWDWFMHFNFCILVKGLLFKVFYR